MARDEKKRQQKLVRKAVKRKKHLQGIKSETGGTGGVTSVARALVLAANAPIHECLVPEQLFQVGIGNVVISREMPSGDLVTAFFLLDVHCLGVKNAFARVLPEYEYRLLVRSFSDRETLKRVQPECARKLVEEAEAYASDLGFSPHPEYEISRRIFGDIDKSGCPLKFKFGKDDKPFYVSGPRDTLARSRRIVETLTKRCGPDGFHYLVALGGTPELADEVDDEDEDDPQLEG